MRFQSLLVLLVVFTGVSVAQDTNFPVGPQYLITTQDPTLLRPIATPSVSLSGEILAGMSQVPSPVEPVVDLSNVYWGDRQPDAVLAPRLQTPIMTADQTAWYMNYVASQNAAVTEASVTEQAEAAALPAPPAQAIEAGATASVIELAGGPPSPNLPSSLFNTGVTGMTDSQLLLQPGYGISLGEVAAYWRTHKRQASHIFTNQDLRRK